MKRVSTGTLCSVLLVLLFGCPALSDIIEEEQKNRAPKVRISPDNVTTANGIGKTFVAEASDEDGDTLAFEWYLNDSKMSGEMSAQCTVTQSPAEQTTYTIKVTVSDGTAHASDTATLTVLAPEAQDEPTGTRLITTDAPQEGTTSTPDDTDWYKISAAAGQIIRVRVSQPASVIDPELSIYFESDLTKAVWSGFSAAEPAEIECGYLLVEQSGFVYLKVNDRDSDEADSETPHTLTATVANNPDANEPGNGLPTGAMSLVSGSSYTGGFIDHLGDEDWYRIAAIGGGSLSIELSQAVSDTDPVVAVFASSDTATAIWTGGDSGEPAAVSHELSPTVAGYYYVRISDSDSNNADPQTAYTITLTSVGAQADPPETVELSSGAPGGGYIESSGDEDWYKITVSEGNLLQVNLSQLESPVEPRVRLYKQSDLTNEVWSKYTGNEPANIVSEWQPITESGSYYLQVTSWGSYSDPDVPYSLTVTERGEPESPGFEPSNNSSAGAVQLTSGVPHLSSYVSHEGDEDWYKITVTDGNLLQVSLSQPESPVEPRVRLYKQGDLTNEVWSKYTGNEPANIVGEWQAVTESGSYYLQVTSWGSYSDPTVSYTLTVTERGEPESPGFEPSNNSSAGAVQLTSGVPHLSSYVSHEGDEDWYKITVSEGNLLQVNLSQLESPVEPRVRLYKQSDLTNEVWSKYTGNEPANIVSEWQAVTESGSYYLQVTSWGSYSDPTVSYTLTVTEESPP